MTRRAILLLCAVTLLALLGATPALASGSPLSRSGGVTPSAADDDIPGVALPASPFGDSLDSATDTDDVYQVWLNVGDILQVQLAVTAADPGFDPRLFLYAPGTPSLTGYDEVALSLQPSFPKSFAYAAPQAGVYYIDAWQEPTQAGDPAVAGDTSLTWSVWRPVYRFYNSQQGSHFYTATEDERLRVIATLASIYQPEGPAYGVNPYTNADRLWRFYKPSTGTHFYTADPDEMTRVRNTLGYLYLFEGEAYNVSRTAAPGRATIWRFYNVRNGTHFYSADPDEVYRVQTTLGYIYRYEGPAFFVAP